MKLYSVIPRILQFVAWWPTYFWFTVFYGFSAEGKENLRGLKSAIFACNHSNELDTIMLTAAVTPFSRFAPMFYVSRERSFYQDEKFGWRRYIYGETFFAMWGAFKAYAGLKDYEKTLRNHIKLLEDGYSLCIFPEGRMTKDGNLQEGHGGVAFLSHRTEVPIVPVRIKGTYRFSFTPLFGGKQKVTVVFGKPLPLSVEKEFSVEKAKQEAQEVMSRIAAL
ncbi:MAG TPA: lysophospholipid acyltransferase family protein [Candidatus Paceibacterota bacterium]|nr:lysophospholipid acyltransferase family protein [Candidatus Paceibacterota bacterium]